MNGIWTRTLSYSYWACAALVSITNFVSHLIAAKFGNTNIHVDQLYDYVTSTDFVSSIYIRTSHEIISKTTNLNSMDYIVLERYASFSTLLHKIE